MTHGHKICITIHQKSDNSTVSGMVDVLTLTRLGSQTGLHKTGICGIQDTRQIVDSKTNDI